MVINGECEVRTMTYERKRLGEREKDFQSWIHAWTPTFITWAKWMTLLPFFTLVKIFIHSRLYYFSWHKL